MGLQTAQIKSNIIVEVSVAGDRPLPFFSARRWQRLILSTENLQNSSCGVTDLYD